MREEASVEVSFKDPRNLVTTADLASEKAIISIIKDCFPTHQILAEESSAPVDRELLGHGPVWVIDPIDGTTNYAHGHPQVGISIGWVFDGVAEVGVVFAPFQSELFSATRGAGAECNGKPISVTKTRELSNALVATGFPYERDGVERIGQRLTRVLAVCRDIRRCGAGSLDLCWVACGRLDAFYEQGLSPWDCAAGKVIVREAGGSISHFAAPDIYPASEREKVAYENDLNGQNLVAATPGILEELIKLLNE